MKLDKKRIYVISITYTLLLALAVITPSETSRKLSLVLISALCALLSFLYIPKRTVLLQQKNMALLVVGLVPIIMIALSFVAGGKFGFYRNPFAPIYLWKYILPYTVLVILSETIRRVWLSQRIKFITIFSFVPLLMLDCLMQMRQGTFDRFDHFVSFFGMTVFPAVSANILFHYISYRYGAMPNIVYRLIVLHYKYLFPVLPKIPSLLEVFVNILMPVLILFLVHALFTKKRRTESRVNRRTGNILSALFVAVAFLFAMLLSCQFTYGLLVIGSPSMTGTIDTGDAIIYRAYRGEIIKEGDIIVFQRNSIQIVHRVIYIQSVNGELRYFTRGDANDSMDAGYVTSDKIVGIVKTKIKYVGLPSLALRTLF